MTKKTVVKRPSKSKYPRYYDGRPEHKQEYNPLLDADIDVNMLHLINFLYLNDVVTLHCCEGGRNIEEYEKYLDGGYIHFLHAEHMERALLLLAGKAREAGMVDVACRALQGNKYARHDPDYRKPRLLDWIYDVSWSLGGPHPCVEESERRGPQGTVFTATLRLPHEDILALNVLLAPASAVASFVDEENGTV